MRLPAAAVAAVEHSVEVVVQDENDPGQPDPTEFDVVVMHNCMWPQLVTAIHELQALGVAVVVDLDDDVDRVPVGNMAHGVARGLHNDCLHAAVQACDVLTVSTPRLLSYAPDKAVLLRNCAPADWLDWPRFTGPATVAWSGGLAWHAGDLETTRGGVARAVRDTGAGVNVVGWGVGVPQALQLDPDTFFTETGWVDFDGYPDWLAKATVGIAPLVNTPFAQAKSWLKPLEFTALGVPVVATGQHAEYAALARSLPAIRLAFNGRGWAREVRFWLEHPEEAKVAVEASRQVIARDLTYEVNAWRWCEAWDTARKARAAA